MKLLSAPILSAPPLSFPGNKKNFRNEYMKELKIRFDDTYTFIDLFGGSGFLSYLTKHVFPEARVIFNDYDNYAKRIQNIPKTNKILEHIRNIIPESNKNDKLSEKTKQEILKYLRELKNKGRYIDYITLSSQLCFTNKLCDSLDSMAQCYFYNNLKKQPIKYPEDYLSGLEIVNEDYQTLYAKYKNESKVVFIIDPPYLASEKRVYKNNYWRLPDYLKLLPILKEQNNWFFFTNAQGYIEDLLRFLDYLNGVDIKRRNNAYYEDLMFITNRNL